MPEDAGPIRKVAWLEVFPWLMLLRGIRQALDSRKMLLAALALLINWAGWWAISWAFSGKADDLHLEGGVDAYSRRPWDALAGFNLWPFERVADPVVEGGSWSVSNPLVDPARRLSDPFRRLFSAGLTVTGLAHAALAALWALLVWSPFGAAITRIAGVEWSREDRLGLRAALRHVRAKWRAYFTAPLLPLVGVLLLVLPMALLGLLMRLDAGVLLGGVFWPLVLLGGAIAAIFLVGLLFGWPLMWGAVSVEGMDSWDALSRAYAYVYQRPLHYLFYALVAAIVGALGWLFVSGFAALVIYLAAWGTSWGATSQRMEEIELAQPAEVAALSWPADPSTAAAALKKERSGTRTAGAALVGASCAGVKLLALAFAYSYFWTASTGIYLLLRRDTDDTPLDDIQLDEPEEPQPQPQKPNEAAVPVDE